MATYDRRVVRGTALLVAARVATAICALAIMKILAVHIDKEAFGRYGSTIALYQIFDVFVDFGSLSAAVRGVAQRPETGRAHVRAAVQFRLVTAAIAVVVSTATALALGDPQVALVALASLTFFAHAAGVHVAVLHADINFLRSEVYRVFGSAAALVLTWLLIVAGYRDAGTMLVAAMGGPAIANLLLAFSVRGTVPLGDMPIHRPSFFVQSLTLGLGAVVRQAYYSLNPLLTRTLAGDLAASKFIPAYRLTGFSILIAVYFGSAVMPALVKLHEENPEEKKRFTRRWTLRLAAIGVAVGLAMYFSREWLLVLAFDESYRSSERVLAPMCITSAVIYVGGFLITQLIAEGRMQATVWASLAGLFANLFMNFTLTPEYGAVGAAWASVVTEVTVAGAAWIALHVWPSRRGRVL
ncbi:MAG: polysaccharide biosynthesis C-terminal domain-containing protein [Planctomycetes bacterium]|nr:polysaccharide biosynthesis C-terminal domain-containing protein [Planctomycetota bacterium]